MASFTVRVELVLPLRGDYPRLYAAMERFGFKQTIRGDDGFEYKLPDGEYRFDGNHAGSQVRDLAYSAAASVDPDCRILVTGPDGSFWSGLDRVEAPRPQMPELLRSAIEAYGSPNTTWPSPLSNPLLVAYGMPGSLPPPPDNSFASDYIDRLLGLKK